MSVHKKFTVVMIADFSHGTYFVEAKRTDVDGSVITESQLVNFACEQGKSEYVEECDVDYDTIRVVAVMEGHHENVYWE